MTMEDYLDAPMISDPLGRLDCDLPIEGAVGLVLSAVETSPDCPNPTRSPGGRRRRQSRHARLGAAADFPAMAAKDAAAQMWARTDLTPADVDVAELYDGFSILTLSWLEALRVLSRGRRRRVRRRGPADRPRWRVASQHLRRQLSAGRLHGFWLFHEAVSQLRGQAGSRQVPGAQVASGFGRRWVPLWLRPLDALIDADAPTALAPASQRDA